MSDYIPCKICKIKNPIPQPHPENAVKIDPILSIIKIHSNELSPSILKAMEKLEETLKKREEMEQSLRKIDDELLSIKQNLIGSIIDFNIKQTEDAANASKQFAKSTDQIKVMCPSNHECLFLSQMDIGERSNWYCSYVEPQNSVSCLCHDMPVFVRRWYCLECGYNICVSCARRRSRISALDYAPNDPIFCPSDILIEQCCAWKDESKNSNLIGQLSKETALYDEAINYGSLVRLSSSSTAYAWNLCLGARRDMRIGYVVMEPTSSRGSWAVRDLCSEEESHYSRAWIEKCPRTALRLNRIGIPMTISQTGTGIEKTIVYFCGRNNCSPLALCIYCIGLKDS